MVSSEALKRLIQRGEGISLEFKRRINSPEKIAKSLIAFANTKGGILLIGIDDNGYIYGVPEEKHPDFEIRKISNTMCSPVIDMEIESVEIDGKMIIYINIPESNLKPHFLISNDNGLSPISYIRHENKSIEASPVKINLMRESNRSKNYSVEIGDDERMLFAFLKQYGIISFEKYIQLSGLSEKSGLERLTHLISIGIIKSVINGEKEYYTLN